MLKVKALAVQENTMKDKYNEGQVVKMWKVTVMLEDGLAEVWTRREVKVGEEITLKIVVGKNYKLAVRVI